MTKASRHFIYFLFLLSPFILIASFFSCFISALTIMTPAKTMYSLFFLAVFAFSNCNSFQCYTRTIQKNLELFGAREESSRTKKKTISPYFLRRQVIQTIVGGTSAAILVGSKKVFASGADTVVDSLDVQDFLRRGVSVNPMGVSGQAGKSRPETGVILRDGSVPIRDERSGAVLAEIVVGTQDQPVAVLASFISPWPLATGAVFDVECRNANTGDGVFLAVTGNTKSATLEDLPDSFFLDELFKPYGRFSFYGPPTDVKVKKSYTSDDKRILEVSFSNLSQSTQSEIPRNAIISVTIPKGTKNAVMLVASASASRWRKGAENAVRSTVDSFRAVPSPKSSFKVRPKDRVNSNAILLSK